MNQLIVELRRLVKEGPHRGEFRVMDDNDTEVGWIRRGSEKDDSARVVAVLPEVDW